MSKRTRRPGRPRLPEAAKRGCVLSIRLTTAERDALDRARRKLRLDWRKFVLTLLDRKTGLRLDLDNAVDAEFVVNEKGKTPGRG